MLPGMTSTRTCHTHSENNVWCGRLAGGQPSLYYCARHTITEGHSKQDQILLVKVGNHVGYCVYRRSYSLWSPVLDGTVRGTCSKRFHRLYSNGAACTVADTAVDPRYRQFSPLTLPEPRELYGAYDKDVTCGTGAVRACVRACVRAIVFQRSVFAERDGRSPIPNSTSTGFAHATIEVCE